MKDLALKLGSPDTVLYHRIPVDLYQKIIDFINKRHYTSRTSAMNDLLAIGLVTTNNIDKIQDPELVSELRSQIHEGNLVQYIESLNPSQIEVLWSIVDNEMKTRSSNWKQRIKGKK